MHIDLHNHTPLCNHAEGSIDEFVKAAIEKGIDIFGFADHAPMDFDEKYRMDFSQMREYEKEVKEAKERYKNQIDILLGYEVDFLPNHMDKRVLNADVDYLIGSVHFIDKWGFDNPEFIGKYKEVDIDSIWQEYFDTVEQMAKSSLFDIAGHLDLIKVFNFMPNRDITELAEGVLDAIKASDMVIELNSAGFRKPVKEAYPSQTILKMAYARNIPITFSSDAHNPKQIAYRYNELKELAKSAGYTECAAFHHRKRKMYNF